ncbi:MAG: hypothetical protein RLZZ210_444 [Pseudomonadota bacterium]|jgi:hypothetical protein
MKIIDVKVIDNYNLIVEFDNHKIKKYDVSKLLNLEAFKPLENIFLFKQVKVDACGYGIMWNDEIDISEYELWTNGIDLD